MHTVVTWFFNNLFYCPLVNACAWLHFILCSLLVYYCIAYAFTHVWSKFESFLMHRFYILFHSIRIQPFNELVNLKYAHLRNRMHTFFFWEGKDCLFSPWQNKVLNSGIDRVYDRLKDKNERKHNKKNSNNIKYESHAVLLLK